MQLICLARCLPHFKFGEIACMLLCQSQTSRRDVPHLFTDVERQQCPICLLTLAWTNWLMRRQKSSCSIVFAPNLTGSRLSDSLSTSFGEQAMLLRTQDCNSVKASTSNPITAMATKNC